ncbi:MAG: hypothetical protein JNL50_04990 [Phycisphaerae bacterium]|nr:hypothetical protein [Phycisphaerae bacterium]
MRTISRGAITGTPNPKTKNGRRSPTVGRIMRRFNNLLAVSLPSGHEIIIIIAVDESISVEISNALVVVPRIHEVVVVIAVHEPITIEIGEARDWTIPENGLVTIGVVVETASDHIDILFVRPNALCPSVVPSVAQDELTQVVPCALTASPKGG